MINAKTMKFMAAGECRNIGYIGVILKADGAYMVFLFGCRVTSRSMMIRSTSSLAVAFRL